MIKRLAFILVLFISLDSVAQGVVKGKIRTESDDPVASITVQINDQTALTNENGEFSINTQKGSARMTVTGVGYETIQKNIVVREARETVINLVLTGTVKQLQTVEIIGRKETGYKNSNSFVGTKTATPLKEVPQAISYVTKEVMQDQQAIRLGDIVKNFSGVNQFTFYDDITIRGFRVQGGEGGVQLINGMRTTTGFWKQSLTNYLERVEVIKGPASALFGNTSPGGTINRVPKNPCRIKDKVYPLPPVASIR